MIRTEIGVDPRVELAVTGITHVEHLVAAVEFGLLLLDDVRLDGDAKVVGLRGQVGRDVIVLAVLLKGVVAKVAPEDRRHAEFVRSMERLRHFNDLPVRVVRPEVNRRTDRRGTELPRFVDRTKHDLTEVIREREKFVVVQLHNERNPVSVLAADASQHAERGRHRVTSALDGEFDDLLAVEVDRVLREARPGGVFDPLIDRKNRDVSRAPEPTMVVDRLNVLEHLWAAVGLHPDPFDKVGTWKMKQIAGDLRGVLEQAVSFVAESFGDRWHLRSAFEYWGVRTGPT